MNASQGFCTTLSRYQNQDSAQSSGRVCHGVRNVTLDSLFDPYPSFFDGYRGMNLTENVRSLIMGICRGR
jgi:hypothetical protein